MLSIKKLQIAIDEKIIIHDISLDIKPGEIHAIMGPNGSGKSTLANTFAGHPKYLVKKGTVQLDKKDILTLSPDQRAPGQPLQHPCPKENSPFLSDCPAKIPKGISATLSEPDPRHA